MAISEKKMELFLHGSLALSAGFLSMIFGFLGKFRIDLGVQKNFQIFFRDEKIIKNPKS